MKLKVDATTDESIPCFFRVETGYGDELICLGTDASTITVLEWLMERDFIRAADILEE